MGGGRFDGDTYRSFANSTKGRTTADIYRSQDINANLNPFGVRIRESRDSADNPNSTPLIVAIDVTGSMGILADNIARKGLGTLFTGILERQPITDPHVMFMAIGDANCDSAPLQVSQFEADKRIIEQLTQIYLEHGGGGNNFESYNLAWYFAGFHTVLDSMEKRNKRGYLFTVGDEEAPAALTKAQIKRFIGDDMQAALSPREMLEVAQQSYNVFHVVIEEGDYAQRSLPSVMSSWTTLLGQQVIPLRDHTRLAETIVSAIEVSEGRDAEASFNGWGGEAAGVVRDAVQRLPRRQLAI